MCRHPAIGVLEKTMNQRDLAEPGKRCGPPNLAGEAEDRVGSAKSLARGGQDFHFFEWIGGIETELTLGPRGLERDEFEATRPTERAAAPGSGHAIAALAVVEDPATSVWGNGGLGWWRIASFCLFC